MKIPTALIEAAARALHDAIPGRPQHKIQEAEICTPAVFDWLTDPRNRDAAVLLLTGFVPILELTSALEIYALRSALAYEAGAAEATLEYRTFPKSRRETAGAAIARMRAAARGCVDTAYADVRPQSLRSELARSGAPATLTRDQWRAQRHLGALPPSDSAAPGRPANG